MLKVSEKTNMQKCPMRHLDVKVKKHASPKGQLLDKHILLIVFGCRGKVAIPFAFQLKNAQQQKLFCLQSNLVMIGGAKQLRLMPSPGRILFFPGLGVHWFWVCHVGFFCLLQGIFAIIMIGNTKLFTNI